MIVQPSPNARLFAVLLALLVVLPVLAFADAGAGAVSLESANRIRETAVKFVQTQSPATATVEAATLDNRLRLPSCPQPLEASAATPANRGAWSILVNCRDGSTPLWSIFVPVKVLDLRPVVVLSRPVAPNQPIPLDALSIESRDVAALSLGYVSDPKAVAGQMLRRPVAPGAPLTPDVLLNEKVIKRGALVMLVGRSGALEVRAQGKALADGGSGERISVENLSSRRVVQGVVKDGGTVEVGL